MTASFSSSAHHRRQLTRWEQVQRTLSLVFAVSTAGAIAAGFLDVNGALVMNATTVANVAAPISAVALLIGVQSSLKQSDVSASNRAYRYAYGIVGLVVIVTLSAAIQLGQVPDSAGLWQWLVGVGMLVIGTPAAIQAWMRP